MRIVETSRNLRSIVTRRSLLPPPGDREDPRWARSWEYLFGLYAPAMARYVRSVLSRATGRVVDLDEANDVVQSYFATCLEKGWLDRRGDEIRCFRAWLQTQLRRYAYGYLDRKHAAKRRPTGAVSHDALERVAGGEPDPADAELDRGWVDVAVELSLEELRVHNADYYEIIVDLLRTDGEGSEDLADRLGKDARQMKNLRHRARRRFAVLLHEHLRQSVRDDEAFADLCARLEAHLP